MAMGMARSASSEPSRGTSIRENMTKSFHTVAEDQYRLFRHHLPDSPFWASVENHGRQLAPMEENLAKMPSL
jgi:hypothetical protein